MHGYKVIAPDRGARAREQSRLHPSLFWRVFVLNAALLVAAAVVLAASPATISFPVRPSQLVVLAAGLVVLLLANALLLRLSLAPLRELNRLMPRIAPLMPGERLEEEGAGELRSVIGTFNQMLARLEWERLASSSRTLGGQEEERRRLALELHDQVGQGLTALLLQLKGLAADAPTDLQPSFASAQTLVRDTLDEVRRIARRLRPTVLDDLGLAYAIHSLIDAFEQTAPFRIEHRLSLELPPLSPEVELALFRIAQESMTNVLRHANASRVEIALRVPSADQVELVVDDDGRGMVHATEAEGGGIRGMRERALTIGARLEIRSQPGQGTQVKVIVPVGEP